MSDLENIQKCFDEILLEYTFEKNKNWQRIGLHSSSNSGIVQIIFDLNGSLVSKAKPKKEPLFVNIKKI